MRRLLQRFQLRIPDAGGQERAIRFPAWYRNAPDLPHRFRLRFRVVGWRILAGSVLVSTLPIAFNYAARTLWWRPAMDTWLTAALANPGSAAPPPPATPLLAAQFAGILLMALAFVLLVPVANRGIARRHTREMLRLRRCPWCAYDLAGMPEALRITCPECGAAWELSEQDPVG